VKILQQKTSGDPEFSRYVGGILDGAHGMKDIVNSMLDVSRIDSNALVLNPTTLYVDTVIYKVLLQIEGSCDERLIDITTQGLKELPPICADPDLLQKVFYQIITNAVKYTPDGGEIHISGQVINEPGSNTQIEIAVCDTGIGIDPQYQELIFQKFFQTGEVLLHSSGKTKFKGGGPGLGLAIAKGIIAAHKGCLWVESPGYDEVKNPGSTFYIRLPLILEGKGISETTIQRTP